MRTLYRAAAALAFALPSLVGPVSAATNPAVVAQATATQGTLSGRITDGSGNPLPNAAIVAEGAGTRQTTTTDASGNFSLTLPPGLYSVTISHGGFQSAQSDVAVVAGTGQTVNLALQELNLQSLRVIGRTSTTGARAPFNATETTISTLPPLQLEIRQNNNLTDTVATMPGVIVSRTFSATPNTNFVVRGAPIQTRVTIDGHPVTSGISGTWNTNYAVAGIFQNVEVLKGTGLNGAIAGESAVGTVNLRTRDFTPNNSTSLQWGWDSYGGGIYNVAADVNFLKDNRLSLIVQKAFQSYNGPWNNNFLDRAGAISPITPGTGQPPNIIGLDQWQGDFSNRYSLQGELAKMRYRFNETSSLTLEYLGLQGQYMPQGGSYGTFDGNMTIQACQNPATRAFIPNLSGCTSQYLYTAPYTFGLIGGTVPAYTWFPQSYIQNNEPTFAAEFRTAIKNDTVLFRPYTHLINRFISGVNENRYPGNGGGWYPVTSVNNCQVKFLAPGAPGGPATGAAGPCFPVTMSPGSTAYVGNDPTVFVAPVNNVAPTCSAAPPFTCFTTPTGIQNNGDFGYSSPFSQPEIDRLNGYTFSYVHPVGPNVYNFTYDYRKDFTQSASTDQTLPATGCSYVIGTVTGTNVYDSTGTPYQPGCTSAQYGPKVTAGTPYAAYNILPRSAIGVPPTVSQYGDFALTGTFQINDKLRLSLGNYFEIYKLNAQIENPTVLAAYAARGNSNAAPVALISGTQNYSHYDPHVGIEYRAAPNFSLRFNAGSSITQPYPSLVSGFGSISIPNAAAHNYTVSIPNFNLKPETTVAYDLGFDNRLPGGSVFSVDAYDFTVHDVFLANTTQIPPVAGVPTFPDTLYLQSQQFNGPLQRSYGLELQWSSLPAVGWGYYLSATANRTFYDQLPLSIYASNTTPGNGNFNVNGAQIFGNPFFKSYMQVLYQQGPKFLFEFGADWEGQNNSTLGPPYVIYDSALQFPVSHGLKLQISAQNLFNLNTGTALGRNLSGQGFFEPTVYLSNGVLLPSGSSTSVQALPPRTFRFTLNYPM